MSEQFNQAYQADGAPFGTRGGTVIRTYLPLDGDYRIHIELADAPREPHQLEVVVDDERVGVISAELPNRPAAPEAETVTKDAAPADVETVTRSWTRSRPRSRSTQSSTAASSSIGGTSPAGRRLRRVSISMCP